MNQSLSSLNNTTLLYTVVYFFILLIYSYKSSKKIKNANDFYLGGGKASVFTLICSLLATILGGSAVLGAIDAYQSMGWSSMWFMIMASFGLLMLVPFVKHLFQAETLLTLPQLISKQYGHSAKVIASIIIPIAWTGIIAAQIITAAKIIISFVDISYELAAVCSGLIFTIYTCTGGQISILKTDKLQAIAIFSGLALMAVTILQSTGWSHIEQLPQSFPFNDTFKPFHLFILILTYGSTFTVGPDIYSRVFCAKDAKVAQKGITITALLLLVCAFCIGLIGAYGEQISNSGYATSFVQVTKTLFSPELHSFYVVVLLSVVLSSADTTLMSAATILRKINDKDDFDKKEELGKIRTYIFAVGIVSIVIAIQVSEIIQTLLYALTFYSGAFVVPILLFFLKIRSSERTAIIAMIVGGCLAITGKIIQDTQHEFMGQLIIILAFVSNFIIMISSHVKHQRNHLKS